MKGNGVEQNKRIALLYVSIILLKNKQNWLHMFTQFAVLFHSNSSYVEVIPEGEENYGYVQ